MDKKDEDVLEELTGVELEVPEATRLRQGVLTGITVKTSDAVKKDEVVLKGASTVRVTNLGATPESSKLKLKMLSKKPHEAKKEKLPEHIRKAYITINDKKKNEPIIVQFSGEWTGSDINMAGKHLILEYNVYVRNRAISK